MRQAPCFPHTHSFLRGLGVESIVQMKKLKPRGEEGLTQTPLHCAKHRQLSNSRALGPGSLGSDSSLLLAQWRQEISLTCMCCSFLVPNKSPDSTSKLLQQGRARRKHSGSGSCYDYCACY